MNFSLLTLFVISTTLLFLILRENARIIGRFSGIERRMLMQDRIRKDGRLLLLILFVAAGSGLVLLMGPA